MGLIFIVGMLLLTGYVCGAAVSRVGLPRVTGYILAGIVLNPGVSHVIPADFAAHTEVITNISLAFITFSVGGMLVFSRIRELGKTILSITFFEAQGAFVLVAAAFMLVGGWLIHVPGATWLSVYLPLALLAGCMACPTDPSATLAVVHEYKAKGKVTDAIMGVAAFDDIMGIINYSVAVLIAAALTTGAPLTAGELVLKPALVIGGAVLMGAAFGAVFNLVTRFLSRESEGSLIVLIFALLSLCYGTAVLIGVDELLATVAMGMAVGNYNDASEKIFAMLERYTEELIFVLFFTISGLHLDFGVVAANVLLIVVFALFRGAGKFAGVALGSSLSHAPAEVRRYTVGGLIPQGGIVIGLALLIHQNPAFGAFSDVLINTIIGATVLHELVGPLFAKAALERAGEIRRS